MTFLMSFFPPLGRRSVAVCFIGFERRDDAAVDKVVHTVGADINLKVIAIVLAAVSDPCIHGEVLIPVSLIEGFAAEVAADGCLSRHNESPYVKECADQIRILLKLCRRHHLLNGTPAACY